jgi:hypothetical protein
MQNPDARSVEGQVEWVALNKRGCNISGTIPDSDSALPELYLSIY